MSHMTIEDATESYENWLGQRIALDAADLKYKHQQMQTGPFPFLRATFYRWAQLWPQRCADLARAPQTLAVGDLHVENFGTWRDAEGRLVWGVNDFDEAAELSYANDLARLAVSANLAIQGSQLQISPDQACRVILKGYAAGLKAGGRPFVLAEDHAWLRRAATSSLRDPEQFWQKMQQLPEAAAPLPASAAQSLESQMPAPGLGYRVVRRRAGEGSLGHARYTALGVWHGAEFAREAKALSPSAVDWAGRKTGPQENLYGVILARAARDPDPWFTARGEWLVRRLAPECSRVELSALPAERDDSALLFSMGFETANIHLGTAGAAKAIRAHLKAQKDDWLASAMKTMTLAVQKDWEEYAGGKGK